MRDHSLVNIPPTGRKCYSLLIWMEEAYDVSVKFWVSIENYGTSPSNFWLYAAGSGDLFDHPNFAGLVHRSRILEEFENGFAVAMWQVLVALEAEFSKIQIPRTARPPL